MISETMTSMERSIDEKIPQAVPRVSWRDYLNLTKPTVTLLVVMTAIPGAVLAADNGMPGFMTLLAVLLGSGLSSASAATFNQLVERQTDRIMDRTKTRSLPTGKVSTVSASTFGIVLGILGFAILYSLATPLAAWIALAGHLFYVFVYTLFLKRRTPQNIVIGGAAGAVGPLIGWAAVTGELSAAAWTMFLIIILWTPPHFWALALKYKEDYAKAGIPMYPVIYGDDKTRWAMMLYAYSLLPCIAALYFLESAGVPFLIFGTVITAKFAWDATKLYRSKNNDGAMRLFHFSCVYTLVIFAFLAVERILMAA